MGEELRLGLGRHQISDLHFGFPPSLLNPTNLEHKIGFSSFIHHSSGVILANEAFPIETSSELLPQGRQTTGVDEPQGWFYCLPRFRQATTPALNTIIKENAAGKSDNRERLFIVVDQSPDRTTLIFSSPLQRFGSWRPKIDGINNMNWEEDFMTERRWTNDSNENQKRDAESVMEEDSEELNALLYSSDEEDEVTSTGHSPTTITTSHDKECTEEVGSSHDRATRKRKALDIRDIDASSSTGESPGNPNDGEDDAESGCGIALKKVSNVFMSWRH